MASPAVLPDYQANMRGVDRGDKLQTYYNIGDKVVEKSAFLCCRMCHFEQLYIGWANLKC